MSMSSKSSMKYLVMQSDSRSLDEDIDTADYHSLSAVVNYFYAKRHGADYLYFEFNQTRPDFLKEVLTKYGVAFQNTTLQQSTEISGTYIKKGPSCYHPTLKAFRAAPWMKLLALWNVSKTFTHNEYSHVLFLDSDAAIVPRRHNISLYDKLLHWQQSNQHHPIHHRQKVMKPADPSTAAMIFTDNVPYVPYDAYPCSGAFVINLGYNSILQFTNTSAYGPKDSGAGFIAAMIKDWWDYPIERRNFNHAYEQDSLWTQLYRNEMHGAQKHEIRRLKSRVTEETVCVVNEHQFPPTRHGLWVSHVGSPWQTDRIRHFRHNLHVMGVNATLFTDTIRYIKSRASSLNSAVAIADAMSKD